LWGSDNVITTTDERVFLERIGLALQVRRRLWGMRPDEIARMAELSTAKWRRLEHGHEGSRIITLIRALKALDVDILRLLVESFEKALLQEVNREDIKRILTEPEKAGRPKKEVEA